MPAPAFVAFGPDHLIVLGGVVVAVAGMIGWARSRRWPRGLRGLEYGLVGVLIASWPAEWLAARSMQAVTWESVLPLHLCDVASFAGAAALLWHRRLAAELAYFWAMAGTLNGLITPALKFGFPHPAFIAFFMLHTSVIVTAAYLIGGLRLWPRPGAVRRVFGCTLIYAAVVAGVNALLGTNFAFIRQKPDTASLMDALGPWPWYVAALVPLALMIFTLLYAPFYFLGKMDRKGA